MSFGSWLCAALFGFAAVLSRWLIFKFDVSGHQDTLCDCVVATGTNEEGGGYTYTKNVLACSAGQRPIKDKQICSKCRGFLCAACLEALLVWTCFIVGLPMFLVGAFPSCQYYTRSCFTCEPVCHGKHVASGVFLAGLVLLTVLVLYLAASVIVTAWVSRDSGMGMGFGPIKYVIAGAQFTMQPPEICIHNDGTVTYLGNTLRWSLWIPITHTKQWRVFCSRCRYFRR